MDQRIKSKAIYLVSMPQGISGWRKPAIPAIVKGVVKRRDLMSSWNGYLGPLVAYTWRLQDGHLPEHQPRVSFDEACKFLDRNPFQAAYPMEVKKL